MRVALLAAALCTATWAQALDKQGSAHGGEVAGASSGFDVSGAVLAGVALWNPTYAARPDNTGLALMRYAAHADVDLIGRRLSLPLDVNFFSDREKGGLQAFVPSEFDIILGLTSTWGVGPGALEAGARVEQDRPIPAGGKTQQYADLRVRYLLDQGERFPALAKLLRGGGLSGWLTFGWFVVNPSYAARPDNSGLALFRYAAHLEIAGFDDRFALGLDATLFTDRFENPVRPSELDTTIELIARRAPFDVHLAWERDAPIDRGGLIQSFVYVLAGWAWDAIPDEPPPSAPPTH